LHNRKKRTNLRKEGETEAVIKIKAALVNSTILLHVTARRLELTRAKNQGRQRKTSAECATRKATIKETVPCLSNSDLITPTKKIKVKPRRQKKQGT
jgi:hypothetical protein